MLRQLFLTGNPCTNLPNYRLIVIRILPQLTLLDSIQITKTEKLQAAQLKDDELPFVSSDLPRLITPADVDETQVYDPENLTMNDPISRIKLARAAEKERLKSEKTAIDPKDPLAKNSVDPTPKFDPATGRILQRNHLEVDFKFKDTLSHIHLTVYFSKFLDTSLINVDLNSTWLSIVVKGKALHLCIPEPIKVDESERLRSQLTGELVFKMPKQSFCSSLPNCSNDESVKSFTGYEIKKKTEGEKKLEDALPLIHPKKILIKPTQTSVRTKRRIFAEDENESDFEDDPNVPPLI